MKTINKGSINLMRVRLPLREDDHAPYYYANIEKNENRKKWKWKVGCKYQGATEEYSFELSKIGDINNEEVWRKITGLEFATELIDLFRDGGEVVVKNWVKNGCP